MDDDTVLRLDVAQGAIGTRRRTPQGGLVANAKLTRTGVLEYAQPDGSVRRELRHPDEVFEAESLASLAHAPVTIDHPQQVTPDNWRKVAVGHVAGAPKRDGKFVAGELHLQDAEAIRLAESGTLQELSCGYRCRLERTDGEYEGERYDGIQRQIRYNHVAAGPSGWGRAGSDVRMHLDGGYGVSGVPYVPGVMPEPIPTPGSPAPAAAPPPSPPPPPPAVNNDARDGQIAYLTSENKRLASENAALIAAAADTKNLDARVDARTALIVKARAALGAEWRADGKTDGAIRREVLAKIDPTLRLDGASDDFVAGAFELATTRADRATQALGGVQYATPRADAPPGAGVKDEVAEARAAMAAKHKNAWKGTK